MKNVILIGVASLVFSVTTWATSCNNASVKGDYVYEMEGMADSTWNSLASVGKITYDGAGNITISGITTLSGITANDSGTGTYSVTSGCVLSSTITTTNGTVSGKSYLDKLVAPTSGSGPYVAYHGSSVGWDATNQMSYRGSITKKIGK